MADKGKFLMRRIEYTPDKVNIYCDIRIKWLQEIYFESIIYLNSVLFNKENFKSYELNDTFISVDIGEWTKFQEKMVSIFRDDIAERHKVIERVNSMLEIAKEDVDEIYNRTINGEMPSRDELERIINYFIKMDTFATFNMYIPHEYYKNILKKYNDSYSVDDFMICAFEPHRMRVNKSKMTLALKDAISDEDIEEYKLSNMAYEEFEKWIFDIEKFKENVYLKREISKMSKHFSKEELENEIKSENDNRNKQLLKYKNILEEMKSINKEESDDDIDSLGFLSVIVSEEEMRHMIECKILVIMGFCFNLMQIDVSRINISDLVKNYSNWR